MSRGLARRFALESRPGTVYSWSTAKPRGQDVAATELSLWERVTVRDLQHASKLDAQARISGPLARLLYPAGWERVRVTDLRQLALAEFAFSRERNFRMSKSKLLGPLACTREMRASRQPVIIHNYVIRVKGPAGFFPARGERQQPFSVAVTRFSLLPQG
jgi:hypothetical protein